MTIASAISRSSQDATDLRQIAFEASFRYPNTYASAGTSRLADEFQDSLKQNRSNNSWKNWVRGWLRGQNKPITNLGNYAVSGSTVDEFAPNVALAIATLAAEIFLDGPINSLALSGSVPFTGSISGTTLTITVASGGRIKIGAALAGNGAVGKIIAQQSGTSGGVGVYTVDTSQTVASGAMTSTGFTPSSGTYAGVYVSAANVVAQTLSDIKSYIKAINDAGARCIYVWERGAASFSTAQIGLMNDFNAALSEFIRYGDDYRGPPNVIVLDPTASSVVTSNATAIALKNSVDGTHDNVEGAKAVALAFLPKLSAIFREVPGHRLSRLTQGKVGVGASGMNPNPAMTGSTAATGTGNTGNVPSSYSTTASGSVSAVFSTQATSADADGNTWGNETKIVATATGAGNVGLLLNLDRTNIATGKKIMGGFEIDVAAGATGLQAVSAYIEAFPTTGGGFPEIDMSASTIGLDAGGYVNFCIEPDPKLIDVFTGTYYCDLAIRVVFASSGSATVIVRKAWAEIL